MRNLLARLWRFNVNYKFLGASGLFLLWFAIEFLNVPNSKDLKEAIWTALVGLGVFHVSTNNTGTKP